MTLVRTSIKLHEVTWQMLPDTGVVHLRLASFDAGVTKDLRRALLEIQRHRVAGIVLDLRNNPGGLLSEAIGVASQFLAGGNVLVARDAQGATDPVPVEKGGLATNVPMAVLINSGSASAAEIRGSRESAQSDANVRLCRPSSRAACWRFQRRCSSSMAWASTRT